MSTLIALDVAVLPPPDVSRLAIALSASLPAEDAEPLRLDDAHLPHVTLMQLFVRQDELETAFARIDDVLHRQAPMRLHVTGAAHSGHTLWLAVERTLDLVDVHERLMESLRGVERLEGSPAAFFGGEGRARDVIWVAGYRLHASFGSFSPHITLGHGPTPPAVEPFTFDATTVAACHLGRFCTCRQVLRTWTLTPAASRPRIS